MERRAKIVCTLGPATAKPGVLRALVEAGMDVARLNFSHGSHEDHRIAYEAVRAASDETGHAVAVLADLQGPKIRLGRFADGPVLWATGEEVVITTEPCEGTHDRVSTTYSGLADDVVTGDRLLVDDGRVALEVLEVDGPDVHLRVTEGGIVSNNKGLNLPGVAVSEPALSGKDYADLRFALQLGVDFIALSFVRSPRDIKPVLSVMDEVGYRIPVLAKIEKPEAVADLQAIVTSFDGLMIARGDLGVEMPLEDVPLVQKRAIITARRMAKPVIVATQMLESMIQASRPTRAEASDVANAVLDGADALMLSGETSVGEHPVEAVATMARIIRASERDLPFMPTGGPLAEYEPVTRSGIIARAASQIAHGLEARAIVAFTQTGDTVRRVARLHSEVPLLAFTPEPAVRSQLALSWGVETFLAPVVTHTDAMLEQMDRQLLTLNRFGPGDVIVMVAGTPLSTPGATNTIRVHRLGGV
ncbi:MAG TPA: pyruvate kinase [Frankiaceae bacterium]